MSERRNHYYIDGSTVRKLDYSAEPVRREYEPVRKTEMPERHPAGRRPERQTAAPARKQMPQRKKQVRTKQAPAVRQRDRRWIDELRHGLFLTFAVICAVGLCFIVLKLSADVKESKKEVTSLQSQLNEQLNANAEYSSGLDSMTDLDEIYKIATTELGMTYSKPGQTVYYSQNSDDYVVQYKNIPETK